MNPETTTTNRLRAPRDAAPFVSGALDEREEAGARPRRGLRHFWVLVHRYAGLTMTLFLVIVGLTGSVLAFYGELDRWLNPELLTVPVRDAPLLDPFTLRERAEALEPRARVGLGGVAPGARGSLRGMATSQDRSRDRQGLQAAL